MNGRSPALDVKAVTTQPHNNGPAGSRRARSQASSRQKPGHRARPSANARRHNSHRPAGPSLPLSSCRSSGNNLIRGLPRAAATGVAV